MGNLAGQVLNAMEDFLRPGITAGDIWNQAVTALAEGDPDIWRKMRSRRLVGWVGHGIGLNIHEPPYLVENENTILKENMVITVEIPSFYGKKLANMPEDVFLINEGGCEKLTHELGPTDIYIRT